MESSSLPPLRNLPCWSRVRDLDQVRYPRLLSSDSVPRPPSLDASHQKALAVPVAAVKDPRVASLQRDVEFLQQQHKDTLERLHAEIDQLRRGNKELQYQLIMKHDHHEKDYRLSGSVSSKSSRGGSSSSVSEKHLYLNRFISSSSVGRGPVASLLPLRISCSPSQKPRAPTLRECELIIRQLHQDNSTKQQELQQLKMLLREIVSENRVPAEIFRLTKDSAENKTEMLGRLPKLPLKPKHPRPPSEAAKEQVLILPSIKNSVSSKNRLERPRRAPDRQQTRFRRSLAS